MVLVDLAIGEILGSYLVAFVAVKREEGRTLGALTLWQNNEILGESPTIR